MTNKTYPTFILMTLLVVLGGIYIVLLKKSPSSVQPAVQEYVPVGVTPDPMIKASPGGSDALRRGGSSYADTSSVYTFLYPAEYKIASQEEGRYTRIYKTGKTQKGQTEIYDGVIVHFERIPLEGKTLEAWVDATLTASTTDGTSEVIQPKAKTSMNGYSGFTYSLRGLGESKYIVIQKDPTSQFAVSITQLVADPESVGYQAEVDDILSTVELLK